MGLFKTVYRLNREVVATAVDDHEHARFPDDTVLPPGVDCEIVTERHNWASRPRDEIYYTVRCKGSLYNVRADELDRAAA